MAASQGRVWAVTAMRREAVKNEAAMVAATIAPDDCRCRMRLARAHQGIACVVLATACFGALDTTAKIASAVVPVVMVMWWRYLFQALVTGIVLGPLRGRALLRTRRPGLQVLRGLTLVLSSALAFISLRTLPLAEFSALLMLTPLVITVIAARGLGERIPAWRWAMLLGGFAGALVVIRPGTDAFNAAMLLPLAVVAASAAYQVLTAQLVKVDDAGTTHFYTGLTGALVGSALLPFFWQTLPHLGWWALLALLGGLSTLGHFLLIQAYGRAPASTLTPYLYCQIGFGTLGGWVAFGDRPDGISMLGIGLIAAFGVAGTWLDAREGAARRLSSAPP